MIGEERLLNYGILGLWTLSLMIDRYKFQRNITNAIVKLTDAIKNKF